MTTPVARPVALPATLTQAQAQSVAHALVKDLLANVAQGGQAVVDASALTQFDSSALAVVLACRRAVLAQGGQLQVLGLPARAQALDGERVVNLGGLRVVDRKGLRHGQCQCIGHGRRADGIP